MTLSNRNISLLLAVCEGNPPVNSPHKGQWRRAFMFSLIYTRTNGWSNKQDAGDWWRHRAHYNVTVVLLFYPYDANVMITISLWRICHVISCWICTGFSSGCQSLVFDDLYIWYTEHKPTTIAETERSVKVTGMVFIGDVDACCQRP